MTAGRIKQLQKTLKYPLLVSNASDLAYLTGHLHLSGSFLLVTKSQTILFGGSLEKVENIKNDSLKNISSYLKGQKFLQVDENISIRNINAIDHFLPKLNFKFVVSPVKQLRLYKDTNELRSIKKSYEITVAVFVETKKYLAKHKNISEQSLAKFIHVKGLELGADDVSFPVIVASGSNSAIPHHVPSNKKIKSGECMVLDFGFKVNGYCSDFTRTVFLGKPARHLEQIYLITEKSYKAAIKILKNKVSAKSVDIAARKILNQNNFEQYFIHSLGHGTGLEVHESPYLYKTSKDILKNNMVFSIEPGVYIEGVGGVRIEDLVYLSNGKVKYFKKYSTALKDMII